MPKNSSPAKRNYVVGMLSATREHTSLKLDLTKRIDVFDVISRRGIVLMFRPLDLYGAYLQEGGILINSNHPPSLQRFTAAHEYGHFVMKHGSSLDDEEDIFAPHQQKNIQETEAQSFAANFLIPHQLLNTSLHRMGLPLEPGSMTPQEAYRLSLDLGVSYRAVINHLLSLKKISYQTSIKLHRKTPKEIKKELGHGRLPRDSWADVWVFDQNDSGRRVTAYINDEFHVCLPEIQSKSEMWSMDTQASITSLVPLIDSDLEIAPPSFSGESDIVCLRRFVFRAQSVGLEKIQIAQHVNQVARSMFDLEITVLPRQQQGLYDQQRAWL